MGGGVNQTKIAYIAAYYLRGLLAARAFRIRSNRRTEWERSFLHLPARHPRC